jgi:HK97 family phage portal protein
VAERALLAGLRHRLRGGRLETKGLPERARASSAGYLVPGVPYRSPDSVKQAVEEGYEGNPFVYRCVEVITDNALKLPVVLFQGGTEETGTKIDDPSRDPTRLVYVLNRVANPWETAKIFRKRLLALYLLSKKGVHVEVIRTMSGKIGMLSILDSDLVSPIPSADDPIANFEISTPNAAVRSVNYLPRFDPKAGVEDQPASVLWIRSPHPLVMWKGESPIDPAGLSIDRYARIYNRRFLQNDGRPGGMVAIKGATTPDQIALIQAQFNGGPESAGRTTVINADSISYADTSGSPRDLMWGELTRATKEEIAMAFGVPLSILTDAGGETFDNADADWATFWESRMVPLLGLLDDQLDVLTGGYDDPYLLRHDTSGVWVLGRHKREREDRAAADLERGAISVDEYREITGRDPVGAPATQVLWLNVGGKMAGTADKQLAQDAVETPMALGPAPPSGDPSGGQPGQPGQIEDSQQPDMGMRLLAGSNDRNGDGTNLPTRERKDMEGKQGSPRPEGSEEIGASWH